MPGLSGFMHSLVRIFCGEREDLDWTVENKLMVDNMAWQCGQPVPTPAGRNFMQGGGGEMTEVEGSEESLMEEAEMNEMIEQLCESKADEFRLIGYEHVSGRDVWECVSDGYHKKGFPPLYQVVNDILSLKVTQFMNYITINMYRGDTR